MFVNLHRHSQWSLLDGTGSGKQYAERAKELGQGALALTDHGTLAGALDHLSSCKDAGIMPVMGCEVYYRDNRLDHTQLVVTDPLTGKEKRKQPRFFHLTLLAMNYQGWLNLQRLTSEAYSSGYYYKPTVDADLLARFNAGIYCLGGCIGGRLADLIKVGYSPDITNYIAMMRSIFGERFSLEIMPHDFDDQRQHNLNTLSVANDFSIPLAATGDAHAPYLEWTDTRDVVFRIGMKISNKKMAELLAKKKAFDEEGAGEDIKIYTQPGVQTLHLMSEHEMMMCFAQYHPLLPGDVVDSALAHTGEIIAGFTPFLPDRDIKMPKFTADVLAKIDPITPFLGEEDPDLLVKKLLRKWAAEGLQELRELYPASHWEKYPYEQYERQIEHELSTFDKIGDHVWRYLVMAGGEVRWAKKEGIVVGPGRGSAAGSLVAYVIGITDIDPIPYDLMFERFINENRKGMPDIDIDFMPGARGRDRVKQHTGWVYNEHGAVNVIDIAAYGTYGPKAALRSICRIFDDVISFQETDVYVKVLDALKPTDKIDLEECAERFPEIAQFKRQYPALWTHATRIEGAPYTTSTHASGVLVKPSGIEVPTAAKRGDDGLLHTMTAWPDTRELLANYGFLKLDYLVIDGLVRQYDVMHGLREREGIDIVLKNLPVRWDPYAVEEEVMEIFRKGMTLGVWQFEGRGTIPVLKAVKPDNMHDIAAINALIRPGSRAAGDTEMYAKIKHGQEPLTYWHDAVEPVLKKTYGLMVYQEQAMEVAVQLGGFTRTEADDLRKAMGKKYREGMPAVIKFLDELGFGPKFINNASKMIGEKSALMVWEKMLAKGGYSFNASHAYAYGLISYHDAMLKVKGPADFYAGYLSTAKSKDLPSKLSGAMREGSKFGTKIKPPDINLSGAEFTVTDRYTILYGLEAVKGVGPVGIKEIIEKRPFRQYEDFDKAIPGRAINKNGRKALIGAGAFDFVGLRSLMSENEKASNEEAYIGVKISGKSDLEKYNALIEETVHTEDEFDMADHGDHLCLGGEIIGIKETYTKSRGDQMGFVTVALGSESFRITLFPKVWNAYRTMFVEGKVVFFEGRKDISDQYGAGFIAQECVELATLVAMKS